MSRYGVGVANPFAALDDDGDFEANQAPVVEEKSAAPATRSQSSANKSANNKDNNNRAPARGGRGPRGGRTGPRPDRAVDAVPSEEKTDRRAGDRTDRPRGRGGRRGERGDRPPKREFDRHSGTGQGREMKKGGSGAHNWGDAVQSESKATEDVTVEKETTEGEAAPAEATEETTPQEPESKELSYEEYLEQLKAKRANLPSVKEIRTVDESEFKGLTLRQPAKVAQSTAEESEEESRKAKKGTMSLQAFFTETGGAPAGYRPPRREEPRGDSRRGGRGGDRRGDDRRPAPEAKPVNKAPRQPRGPAPDISNSAAFPSLK